ncbi:hypothetical protein [Pseudomonas syringae]|uniref:hypothetical protein n=1 Tax=Pseudomonas syringae TaxID=317 RepID=UPI001F336C20|nr:hypothetical protein [Pseudomonas syringae]GKQ44392.1 hypothetical protein PSTH2693_04570 [Pseudomonas syringae pv. theae]
MAKIEKEVERFDVKDGSGDVYTLLKFQEFSVIGVDNVPGYASYRTREGKVVMHDPKYPDIFRLVSGVTLDWVDARRI